MDIVPVVKSLNIINIYAVNDQVTGPDIQYYAYSMKRLNNFEIVLPSDFEHLHIKNDTLHFI